MAYSSSRARSSSPFGNRKPSTSYLSSSSSNGRLFPRSSSSSSSSSSKFYGSNNGMPGRSTTPSRGRSDSLLYPRGRTDRASPIGFATAEELSAEAIEGSGSSESISVTVRFRPLSERELQRGDELAWYADGDKVIRSEYNPATAYAFDRVFGPATQSKVVYDVAARPVVKAAMEGVNGTVFAYGVTSSGKTHTMHGDQQSPGVIPLAIKDVFSIIQDTPGREFLLRVSYLEIYNEVINDLLDPTGQNLRVREDAQGTYVEGIKEEVVLSPGHALSFIASGEEHRHVGSNNFNLLSSRSHTIFTLMIESSARGDEYDGVMFSQLNLIDLAGSESSKTETTGLRRKEGSYINKSLLTLGTVIGKLSEGKASHIPYRDSKLTRLLQSSLSGHGHVSLICTVTPASSNMEETHNTLKFASRAKRVEIFASRNKIIDEKSLIKKYQKEISSLKQELEQLKSGMFTGVNQEEILSLRQQLEEGQVKMQSRLEEEEEAKVALMSRIQRLTKLILVSTKNSIPGCLNDVSGLQKIRFHGEEDKIISSIDQKIDILHDGSSFILDNGDTTKDPFSNSSSLTSNPSCGLRNRKFSSSCNEVQSPRSLITDASHHEGISKSDEMDLLVEQVKMLTGEIAFGTSTLKRLLDQSANDPSASQMQIQKLEAEIQEKRRQMRILEKRILENNETSMSNVSIADMQQKVTRLMAQLNEKSFELEIKSADNRILQEQLEQKNTESKELKEKVQLLQQQQLSVATDRQCVPLVSEEYLDELKQKVQSQEVENEKLKIEHVQLIEENSGLVVQNQKLSEEASYAKELASAAAVELKNLAGEVTKLSLVNARQAEMLAVRDMPNSRGSHLPNGICGNRKYSDKIDGSKPGRKSRLPIINDDVESWSLDPDDKKKELMAMKQREAALEAALAEKEIIEEEYRRKLDEAKKREASLENDLAGMWVLVAKLKRGGVDVPELSKDRGSSNRIDFTNKIQVNEIDHKESILKEREFSDAWAKPVNEWDKSAQIEPLLFQLKARMQEMKEKEIDSLGNEDGNSHICKVCFESPTAAVLLPCRHFCLCKPCSLACTECPLCRTKITDRIIAYT